MGSSRGGQGPIDHVDAPESSPSRKLRDLQRIASRSDTAYARNVRPDVPETRVMLSAESISASTAQTSIDACCGRTFMKDITE